MQKESWLALVGCAILQWPIWGAAMTFGVLQDAYNSDPDFSASTSLTGIIGTTMNGVMYLSMPLLFTVLDGGFLTKWRRAISITGVALEGLSWVASSFAGNASHLVVLQGVTAALGSTLVYSASTMYLDERFTTGRATAYGVMLSSKNVVGTVGPILISVLVEHLGVRWTLRIWGILVLLLGAIGLFIIPRSMNTQRVPSPVPWTFLKHRTFYVYSIANICFSSGYGLPQTYLPSHAKEVMHLSSLVSSLMITLFNAPGIISSVGFGLLSDKLAMSGSTTALISASGAALFTLLLWGFGSASNLAVLITYSVGYGFFASAFSSTWCGWITEFEQEAERKHESLNTGMLYGFFNGARGIGYLVGGIAGAELLQLGGLAKRLEWGYGTQYGTIILFTGISSIVGGSGIFLRGCEQVQRRRQRQRQVAAAA